MKTILLISLVLCASVKPIVAHNAKIATFSLRDTGAGWFVEMNFARAGVDAVMIEQYGSQKLEGLSKKVYQKMIVDYVKENFNLVVDGRPVNLGSGAINLGTHQTDVKFVLPDVPIHPASAKVYIPMFGESYDHTNVFSIYRRGKNIAKIFLNEDNDFRVDLHFTQDEAIVVKEQPTDHKFILFGSGGLALAIVLALVTISRKKLES